MHSLTTREAIARALVPRVVVCDNAVSAPGKSVATQVPNLQADLGAEFELSHSFIRLDLNVMRHVTDDVLVIYLGP